MTRAAETADGFRHLREGRVAEALAFFRARLGERPDDVAALNMVGAILCLRDEPEASLHYFEEALRHSPSFVPARKNLAIAQFELGRYESAAKNLRELLSSPEASAQASLFLGMIASESGQHGEAVQLLVNAGDLVASQPRAQIAYARSLAYLGKSDIAREFLQAARAREDLTAPDLVDSAQVAAQAGFFSDALSDLERAQSLGAALEGVGGRRVEVLIQAGREQEALALARQLIHQASSRALLSRLAKLAESAGDLDTAVIALRRAVGVEPKSEDSYIELAEFCVRYRNLDLAIEILDLGLKRYPSSYRLLVQKGITLGQGQRYDEARQEFTAAIAMTDEHSVALTALAVSLILSESLLDALETLRSGIARFPRDFYMHYIYGFALDRSRAEIRDGGAKALAEKHFRQSIELNPAFPGSYYRLGKLMAEDDMEEAIRNLEEAIRLDPSLVSAKYQLGQLYLDAGRHDEGARLVREVGEAKQLDLEHEQMPQFRVVKDPPGQ